MAVSVTHFRLLLWSGTQYSTVLQAYFLFVCKPTIRGLGAMSVSSVNRLEHTWLADVVFMA